jgi:hypothetical protein
MMPIMNKKEQEKRQKIESDKNVSWKPGIVEYEVAWNEGTNLSKLQFGNGRLDISVEE